MIIFKRPSMSAYRGTKHQQLQNNTDDSNTRAVLMERYSVLVTFFLPWKTIPGNVNYGKKMFF